MHGLNSTITIRRVTHIIFEGDLLGTEAYREEYLENKRRAAEALAASLESARALVGAGGKSFFEEHPVAEEVSWVQYTPYFNDGDECIFSVRDYSVNINGYNPDYDEGEVVDDETRLLLNRARGQFQGFLGTLEALELKAIFGDHVRVTVTPKGARVEQYDHE